MMHETLLQLPLTVANLTKVSDPHAVHRLTMSKLPSLKGASSTPRATMGVLYQVGLPGEPGESMSIITVRMRTSMALKDSVPADLPQDGEVFDLKVRLAAERRFSDHTSGRKIHCRPVRDDQIEDWLLDRFARCGFEVQVGTLRCSDLRRRGEMSKVSHAVREVGAQVKVIDVELAHQAWLQGMGRGKSYGLGMLRRA